MMPHLEHVRHDEPRQQQGRGRFTRKRFLDPVERHVLVMTKGLNAGIIDEHVNGTELAKGRVDEPLQIVSLSHVHGDGRDTLTPAFLTLGGPYERVGVPGRDDEVRPGPCQPAGDGQPDPAEARDQRRLSAKVESTVEHGRSGRRFRGSTGSCPARIASNSAATSPESAASISARTRATSRPSIKR